MGNSLLIDEFCGSKFWDWDLTWYTNDPDLTLCFQKTVLVWIPSAFLWIFAILTYSFRSHHRIKIPWSLFNILKIVLCLVLIVLQITKLTNELVLNGQGYTVYSLDLYTPILELGTYVVALATIVSSKNTGMRSSGVQFGFWFLKTACETVPFRMQIRTYASEESQGDLLEFLVKIISYPIIVAQLLLNCWADAGIDYEQKSYNPKERDKSCPKNQASALNKLLFSWFDPLAWKGHKRPLETTDLWELDEKLTTSSLIKTFDKNWSSKVNQMDIEAQKGGKEKPISILSVLFASYGQQFVLGSMLKLLPDLLSFVSPQILNLLILFVSGDEELWKGYLYAGLLLVTEVASILGNNHHMDAMFMTNFRVKSALMAAIYRKSLVISNATRRERTVGEIVNLMSVDVNNIVGILPFISVVWSGPLQIALALYFLWGVVGPSALAGLGVMLLLIPLNGFIGNKLKAYQILVMKSKDDRVKLMSEMLSGMKILKLYAWEPSFQNEVMRIREKEVRTLTHVAYASAFNDLTWTCSQFLVILVTFATFVLVDDKNVLDARVAFVSLALLNVLNRPLSALPMVVVSSIQAGVSVNRLNQFMNSDEIDFGAVTNDPNEDAIVIENGSFAWDSTEGNVLENVNLQLKKGSLVAVVGVVGSGKSSLLSAILGEMEITAGRVNKIGNVSYASQLPWIQNASLRENILFGRPYEPDKYSKVIEACCLNPDLDIFPGQDKIEIGEKGINLSGGQKQRVSVARAVYNQAGIYIFDDPLSAVDAHVGKDMFDNVFGPNGLLRKKTRILVTHSVTFLSQMDQIIVLKNGRVSEIETYSHLLERQGEFSDFLAQYSKQESKELTELSEIGAIRGRIRRLTSATSDCSEKSAVCKGQASTPLTSTKDIPEAQKLIGEEFKETTSVPWRLYRDYFQAAGWMRIFVSLGLYTLYQGFAISASYWLSIWSEKEIVNGTQIHQGTNVGIYAALGLSQSFMFLIATTLMCLCILRAAANFHSKMLYSILRAPMSFFDTTPTGRILNRFAKDVDVLDNTLSFIIRNWFSILVNVVGTFAIIAYNLPMFAIVILPLGILYYLVQVSRIVPNFLSPSVNVCFS